MYENYIIIDDDETYRQVLSRSLDKLGYQVAHFGKPKDALMEIQNTLKPLVLLDLKLDEDSGLRWIEAIRQRNPGCHIILLTGYASIATAVEAIKLGANDYLSKPVTARDIVNHLAAHNNRGVETAISNKPMSVERLEWEHIQKVLSHYGGNISASARALGMHRRTLQRKLAKKPAKK